VFRLLVDIGSIIDENRAPGTCYAALSRPHTIGDLNSNPNKKSALYFIGNDICFNRIKSIGLTKSCEQAAFIKSRQLWVNFLNDQKLKTDGWITTNRENWTKIYHEHIKNKSETKPCMEKKIFEHIKCLKTNLI